MNNMSMEAYKNLQIESEFYYKLKEAEKVFKQKNVMLEYLSQAVDLEWQCLLTNSKE